MPYFRRFKRKKFKYICKFLTFVRGKCDPKYVKVENYVQVVETMT